MQAKSSSLLMGKATQAVQSARLLLERGDVDGACNRAYYAMFDAAQAALLVAGVPTPETMGKTQRGLINAFSAYLVKDGPVSKELGRQLKRAEEMRLVADYNGESVTPADAAMLVRHAELFLTSMHELFFSRPKTPDGSG